MYRQMVETKTRLRNFTKMVIRQRLYLQKNKRGPAFNKKQDPLTKYVD